MIGISRASIEVESSLTVDCRFDTEDWRLETWALRESISAWFAVVVVVTVPKMLVVVVKVEVVVTA